LVKKDDGSMKMELSSLPDGVPEDKGDMPWPWFMNCGWDKNRELIGWSLDSMGNSGTKMELTGVIKGFRTLLYRTPNFLLAS